jgi:hypothetical protein
MYSRWLLPLWSRLAFATLIVASAIAWGHGGSGHFQGETTAAEKTAFADAHPAFEKHCLRCHAKDGKKAKAKARAHLDMTTFPFGGHHAGEAGQAVRAALGAGPKGTHATMPTDNPGTVAGADLKLILAWADQFTAAHRSAADNAAKHEQ